MYDLAVIGAGPGGYVAAEKAAKKGLQVVLFEKNELGGVCLNEGCIPTKTLLYSAKLYDNATHSEKYGITVDGVSFDYSRMVDRKEKVRKKLVGGVRVKMRDAGVQVVRAEAVIGPRCEDGTFSVSAEGQEYITRNLLICTGSEAFIPPIPGLAEAGDRIVTNRELLSLREVPQELVIIGGGVIGMEFASLYNSLGSKVTVIEMLPEILGGLDKEISAMLRQIYTKKGVTFCLGCKVVAIEDGTVVYVTADGQECRVSGDRILVSVGRRANLKGFGLENLGVGTGRGIVVDDHMRTSVPGVYAAGDVTGFSLLAHTASREAEVAVNDMLGIDDVMRYDAVPGVVYTNPEVAGAGLTEEQAAERGGVRVIKLPMAYSGRFVAENEGGNGLCKIIADESSHRVLGVHMIGNPCSEMIHSACIAIEKGFTAEDLQKVIFPHPTVSEIIRETAFTLE